MVDTQIEQKAKFDFIRYASVWEDADVLCSALESVAKSGRVLSIASSGDNALSLLTLDPQEVVAVDMNPTQIACTEIRKEAFRSLDYQTILGFFGVSPMENRQEIYKNLREKLTVNSREFWDQNPDLIQAGIVHVGKFEKYLCMFGKKILPWIHSKWKRQFLMDSHSEDEREEFYRKHWNTWLWKGLFRVFFSRTVMGKRGRDPAFFDHVEGSVADKILSRTQHALTKIPTDTNPYLTYIITGNYSQKALPRYLRQEFFQTIKDRVDRLTLLEGPIQKAEGKFDGFNLSDIFEYMNDEEFLTCYEGLVDMAGPNARMVYWNMLVPRKAPESFSEKVNVLDKTAKALHAIDKAWFYQALHVDEVK